MDFGGEQETSKDRSKESKVIGNTNQAKAQGGIPCLC